jgi:hypothetical protein
VNIKLSFVGANPHPRIEPFHRLATHISYFLGSDMTKWHADVPVWGGVRYVDLYPGIDLELSGEDGKWQPRLIPQPGADVSAVRLRLEGSQDGVQETGDLALLRAYPFNPLPASVNSLPDTLTALLYSTFLGGSDYDVGAGVAVDASGAVYLTGHTRSTDFPTSTGAFTTTYGGGTLDAFVVKLSPEGNGQQDLIYATFLGGSDRDGGMGIAVDASGRAIVAGLTASADFPTTPGAFQTYFREGYYDNFITKLNSTGSALDYCTYLGGSGWDVSYGPALDANGAAYLTGYTTSSDFPVTSGAFQPSLHSTSDAFITKLSPDGSALSYSTYLGGNDYNYGDAGLGIAVDAGGAAYAVGYTTAADFPTTSGAYQTAFGGWTDAWVAKLNPAGNGQADLVYSTYLGGSDFDHGYSVTVDASGAAYVIGETDSTDFPAMWGYYHGATDAFVTKLNPQGSDLLYSLFLGGSDFDYGRDVAIDGEGNAYLTGSTASLDFPTTPGAFQPGSQGGRDGFVTRLSSAGVQILYSTYLGSNNTDYPLRIAIDVQGVAYITGGTDSRTFPVTVGAFQTTHGGGEDDAFLTQLALVPLAKQVYLPLVQHDH